MSHLFAKTHVTGKQTRVHGVHLVQEAARGLHHRHGNTQHGHQDNQKYRLVTTRHPENTSQKMNNQKHKKLKPEYSKKQTTKNTKFINQIF